MRIEERSCLVVEQKAIASRWLKRYVIVDIYLPRNVSEPGVMSLLLLNDGQNLEEMNYAQIMNQMLESNQIEPVVSVGIHANKNRLQEYGTSQVRDYEDRGSLSKNYQLFILEELLPFIHSSYAIESFREKAIAGFSLGGLSALDTLWQYPDVFSVVGVFSGSLWWRSRDLGDHYNDDTDRIMHQEIRKGKYIPGLRFYFTTGSMDETADRNQNGIIDSIDDTLDLIEELKKVGYNTDYDIKYINYEDGRHDIETWGRSMPGFLLWAFSRKMVNQITE